MLTLERRAYILKVLDEKRAVSVGELSERFRVSEVTVRKMLTDLARQGLLRRTHGGAVSMAVAVREARLHAKEKANTNKKKDIARKAYDLIDDYDAVYIDAGSTTLELVRLVRNGGKRNITVVTNALNIAVELLDVSDLEVVLTGGRLRHGVVSCVGPVATASVSAMVFDKAFIGANNVTLRHGATTPDMAEAEIKRAAAAAGDKSYLLCDSTKFTGCSMAKLSPLDSYTAIITDAGLPVAARKAFIEAGVALVIAEPRAEKSDSAA